MRVLSLVWLCLATIVCAQGACLGQVSAQVPPPAETDSVLPTEAAVLSSEPAAAQPESPVVPLEPAPALVASTPEETSTPEKHPSASNQHNPGPATVLPSNPPGMAELITQQNCEFYEISAFEESWYLACGSQGLWVLSITSLDARSSESAPAARVAGAGNSTQLVALGDVNFRLTKRTYPGARVVGLTRKEGELSAKIQLFVALKQNGRPSNDVLVAFDPQADPRVAALSAQVLVIDELRVKIDVGAAHGVAPGDRMEFDTPHQVVGRVVEVHESESWVRLGMGEELPQVGSPVHRTSRSPTRMLAFPRNTPYRASILVGGRIGSIVREDGVMGIGELNAFVQLGSLRLGVQTGPVGGGGGIFIYQVAGSLGVHRTVAGFDLMFGSMSVNSPDDIPSGTGIAFGPSVRLGPEDGLHMKTRALLAISYQKPMIGEVRVSFQTPIYQGAWILMRGSGGKLGMASFDLGPKFLLAGNGGPGSSLLHVFGGPLFIYKRENTSASISNFIEQAGPAFGFEWEVRL